LTAGRSRVNPAAFPPFAFVFFLGIAAIALAAAQSTAERFAGAKSAT
jgi:hypothetical protein